MLAVKRELNDRARTELTEALKSGDARSELVVYNQQVVTNYDGMAQGRARRAGLDRDDARRRANPS